jgi:basic membrane protein A and related proteins
VRKLPFYLLFLYSLKSFSVIAAVPKVGLVLDKGGRDDKSFNSAAYKGAKEAEKLLGIKLKVVESSDDTAIEPSLRTFAQHKYDLVIGIGFIMLGPIEKVAKQFPNTHFLLIDSPLELPNVRSVIFKEHEGSYVVGAIAALTSKTHTIGFVGGMDIPLIRRFELAYRAGAVATDPKVKVLTNYVGTSSDAWRNPTKGKELALAQIGSGADVIFAAAGASGMGVFDAVEEKSKFAIGVDSNQNWVKPGRILTSMIKRVDLAVLESIQAETQGKFQAGKFEMGIHEGAIDYALDEHNRSILKPEVEKRANELKKDLVAQKIQAPDFYKIKRPRN